MSTRTKDILGIAWRVAFLAALIYVVVAYFDELTNLDIKALLGDGRSVLSAGAIVVGIYAIKGLVFVVPAAVLYMGLSMVFEVPAALLVGFIGITAELTLTYFMGRLLGGQYVVKKLNDTKYGSKIIDLQNKELKYFFIARLIPGLPIDFISLFFGATKMNFVKYITISVLGSMPRIVVMILLGEKIYEVLPMRVILAAICFAAITVVAVWVARYIYKKVTAKDELLPNEK